MTFHAAHPPVSPIRDRCMGDLRDTVDRSLDHDRPSPELILHFAWAFLIPDERYTLSQAFPVMGAYANLRRYASTAPLHQLLDVRDYRNVTCIDDERLRLMSAALLRFNFQPGDLVRWLGRDYTHTFLDFDALEAFLATLRHRQPRPGQPPVEIDRALRAWREGTPLSGDFWCDRDDVLRRNLYNNHDQVHEHVDLILQDIINDEAASFNLVVYRWLFRFVPGIHIALANIVFRKGKSRQIIDPSSTIHPSDTGAVNTQVLKYDTSIVPRVHYSSVFERTCRSAFRLRATCPNQEILGYVDDITKAFKRMRYHPQFIPLFAWVFQEYLVLPIGTIFGSRFSPGWFCLGSEIRAFIAMASEELRNAPLCDLAQQVSLPPPLAESDHLARACTDALNPELSADEVASPTLNTFVDDTLSIALASHMPATINASFRAAFKCYGEPSPSRPAVISEEKFEREAHYRVHGIGLLFDYRQLKVSIPIDKRRNLLTTLTSYWTEPDPITWQQAQSLCGVLRNIGNVLPLGIFSSIRLQQQITISIREATSRLHHLPHHLRFRAIPKRRRAFVPRPDVLEDLAMLRAFIDFQEDSPVWSRPMGLFFRRVPHCILETDMSTGDKSGTKGGLGGTVSPLQAMWRLSNVDIIALGIDPTYLRPRGAEFGDEEALLHVNIGEFIAIVINVWLAIVLAQRQPVPPGGWIWKAGADNTSALSWMRYASRTRSPVIMSLARFLTALITFAPFPLTLQGYHIKGCDNLGPDALSRPHEFPTWGSVFAVVPALSRYEAFRIPRELICTLTEVILQQLPSQRMKERIERLWIIEPTTFNHSAPRSASRTSLSLPARAKRRKR